MKKKGLLLIFGYALILGCSAQKEVIFRGDNFSITEIYEGANKYSIPAIIIETDKKFNKSEAIETRDYISGNKKITTSNVKSSTIVFKRKKDVYAILSVDKYQKPFKDVFLPIDLIKSTIGSRLNQKKTKPKIEDCYLFLGTNNFAEDINKFMAYYWVKPEATYHEVDSLKSQSQWINSTGYYDQILERGNELLLKEASFTFTLKNADRLIRLESGDMVRYSVKYSAYTSYYLRLD